MARILLQYGVETIDVGGQAYVPFKNAKGQLTIAQSVRTLLQRYQKSSGKKFKTISDEAGLTVLRLA